MHVAAVRQLHLNLTQQLQYVLVRMSFPSHHNLPYLEQNSGPVLGGKDNALVAALSNLTSDKSFKLGSKGYVVRRAKGKGASGFVAQKVS